VIAKRILRSGKTIRVVSAKSLPEDATVVTVGIMGAPSVLIGALCYVVSELVFRILFGSVHGLAFVRACVPAEKIPRGDECVRALRAVEQASGRKADALMSIEIGGLNSVEPLSAGALTGVPVIDYDGVGEPLACLLLTSFHVLIGMLPASGRAFPELQMFAPMMYGLSPTPTALCDEVSARASLLAC
jgi:DUF917 family protein